MTLPLPLRETDAVMSETTSVLSAFRAVAAAGVGASQLAGQIHATARDDSGVARHSADVLGPRLRAKCCDCGDISRAAGRSLCISFDQILLRYRVDSVCSFRRISLGSVIHSEPGDRSGRRDRFLFVPGRDRHRAGFQAVHREERYARHYQRLDLRLPADGRGVCVRLRGHRTASSRFVQHRTFSKVVREHRASHSVASQLHLLQLRVPDDDRVSAISRRFRGRAQPLGDGGGVRPVVYGYSDRAPGRSRSRAIDDAGALHRRIRHSANPFADHSIGRPT